VSIPLDIDKTWALIPGGRCNSMRSTSKRLVVLVAISMVTLLIRPMVATAATLEFNRALGGTTKQSSTDYGGEATRAVDDNTDGNFSANSVTHTAYEDQPFWQVDLGGSYAIDTVELFNRTDCCGDRLSNVFVFVSEQPMTLRRATDVFQQEGVVPRAVFGQAADHQVVTVGQRGRYVRVQLSGTGVLSLAEVRVIERVNVDGPQLLGASTTWTPTHVFTPGTALGAAELDGELHSFQRGADGRLHASRSLKTDVMVDGSPLIADDLVAVTVDPDTESAFIGVRTVNGRLDVATSEKPSDPSVGRTWTWEDIGATDAGPSLLVAESHLIVAWLDRGQIRTTWKDATGGPWTATTTRSDGITPPSLARNSFGTVAMAFLRSGHTIHVIRGYVGTFGVTWSLRETITGTSPGKRVGIASWGSRFMVSTIGGDSRPYFAIEQRKDGLVGWVGFERAWGTSEVLLKEAPTITLFAGMIVLLARDRANALHYWIRNPNTIANRYSALDMWLGGGIVGGAGTGAAPAAVGAVGHSRVWGIWDSHSELYAITRGINDNQLYGLNLGRFIALDILGNRFGIKMTGAPSDPALDVKSVQNLFEHMVAVLALLTPAWSQVSHNPSCTPSNSGVQVLLDPAMAGQTRGGQCPPEMFLNASYQHSFFMFHEWMHMDFARRNIASMAGFGPVFGNAAPKLCATDADCSGDACKLNDDDFGMYDDPTIRRWIGKKVCMSDGRVQGHATTYGLQSDEHDFIEAAQLYRWHGDQLREYAERDFVHGNAHLWKMYEWFRDHYFDGGEYNGETDISGAATDRNLGQWGMPKD